MVDASTGFAFHFHWGTDHRITDKDKGRIPQKKKKHSDSTTETKWSGGKEQMSFLTEKHTIRKSNTQIGNGLSEHQGE